MSSRDEIEWRQLAVSNEKMAKAVRRAEENSKRWVVWNDKPKHNCNRCRDSGVVDANIFRGDVCVARAGEVCDCIAGQTLS